MDSFFMFAVTSPCCFRQRRRTRLISLISNAQEKKAAIALMSSVVYGSSGLDNLEPVLESCPHANIQKPDSADRTHDVLFEIKLSLFVSI